MIFLYPSLGWKIRALMTIPAAQNGDYKNIAAENELLKARIAALENLKSSASGPQKLVQASVYSDYPFNFKNEILVDKGEADGVKVGQPVLLFVSQRGSLLIGKVEKIFKNSALVETIFDSRFKTSVRIGNRGVNSLLVGGSAPKLMLIPKDSEVRDGEGVYSASSDYPLGTPIGVARNIRISSDQFFKEADLETAYNPNDFQTVFIDKNYEPQSAK